MQILRRIPYWGVVALLVYMPFHIFLSQSLSLVTGGLEAWKVGKDVVVAVLTLFTVFLVWRQGRVPRWYTLLVVGGMAYAAVHLLVWAAHPQIYRDSALIGIAYNVRLLCFVVVGAGAALLNANVFTFRSVTKVVVAVSTLVAALAILQYFMPADILTHLGYSLDRGVRPAFFIDDNPAFLRVMSTLRDPNSLGAYLLVPIALLAGLCVRLRGFSVWRRAVLVVVSMVHLAALYLTFSRSAWIGAFIVLATTIWWHFSSYLVRSLRRWGLPVAAVIVVVLGLAYWQRHNTALDGILTHSTAAQIGQYDSNQLHWRYVQHGISLIWQQPLGHGPGTAGLASIRNPSGGLLTENYYIQIGYEVGVLGAVLFIALNIWIYLRVHRRHDQWAMLLVATFWAYVVINLLLHSWSNEAVAAQWWLLAGIALALPLAKNGREHATKRRAVS